MNTHFLNPIAETHSRRTDEIIEAYERGEISQQQAGDLMFEHVFGSGRIAEQLKD